VFYSIRTYIFYCWTYFHSWPCLFLNLFVLLLNVFPLLAMSVLELICCTVKLLSIVDHICYRTYPTYLYFLTLPLPSGYEHICSTIKLHAIAGPVCFQTYLLYCQTSFHCWPCLFLNLFVKLSNFLTFPTLSVYELISSTVGLISFADTVWFRTYLFNYYTSFNCRPFLLSNLHILLDIFWHCLFSN